ncbi:MAG TPA: hypothetical protein VG711_00490, partial [Phycisphaerales bacterium]|nr:hypothetical protein [Phycisphaerales bacterium]
LRKGERAVIPVKSFALEYEDVYSLKLPITPPSDVRVNWNDQQRDEVAKMLRESKMQHVLRIKNTSNAPLTTAPTLFLKGSQVLSQGLMTYTAIGATSDIVLATAVDIRYTKEEKETSREPSVEHWNGHDFARVNYAGVITLENYKSKPVKVEVVRSVLGNVGETDQNGTAIMLNQFEDSEDHIDLGSRPMWWGWYSWPYGWFHFNGMGAFTWTVTVEPGKPMKLNYSWNYYWP